MLLEQDRTATLPLSHKLVSLANNDLSELDKAKLLIIVDQLFLDIELGHSCSLLENLATLTELTPNSVLDLLARSSLATYYESLPQELIATALSIVKFATNTLVYISKYLQYELNIITQLRALNVPSHIDINRYASYKINLTNLHKEHDLPNKEQLNALEVALKNKLSIITGGPGTGKTTIIMLLLWISYNIYSADLKIKICAPTGRAAARVKESLSSNLNSFKNNNWGLDYQSLDILLTDNDNFTTIHKLLGAIRHSIYFKHNQDHLLDIDILIIDESSMISLPLFSKLLMAINASNIKHVIFLGDKNQLSSVEEGYVFASLTSATIDNNSIDLLSNLVPIDNGAFYLQLPNVYLTESKRNNQVIASLASSILAGEIVQVFRMFATCKAQLQLEPCNLKHLKSNLIKHDLQGSYGEYFKYIQAIIRLEDFDESLVDTFKYLQKYRILCLTNSGVYGSTNINLLIEQQAKHILQTTDDWYLGRPILILENDYSLGLFNGDIGICKIDNKGQASICFGTTHGDIKSFIPEMLPRFALAYAITIHKSQGSEFDQVSIILGAKRNAIMDKILTKELLYTAVTRAKSKVNIYASNELVSWAISNPTLRNTGLNN